MPLQIRRGLDSEREAKVFADGEIVFSYPDTGSKDEGRLYIGDGTTQGGIQVTGFTGEDAIDAVGAALAGGTHQNISFTYGSAQDIANRIDATVSLSTLLEDLNLNGYNIVGTGNIAIQGGFDGDLKGSVFADDSTILVDGVTGVLRGHHIGTLTGDVEGNVSGDLLGNVIGNVEGNLTGNVVGNIIGDVKGSVYGDDSSMLVDGTNGVISGNVENLSTNSLEFIAGSATTDGIIKAYNVTTNFTEFNTITGGGSNAWIDIQSSRGTISSPTATQDTDPLSGLLLFGHNGTAFKRSVVVGAWQDGAVANGEVPGKFIVYTSNADGADGVNEMSFNSTGVLYAPVIKVGSGLPASPEPGMIVLDSGTFYGYTGSAWVALH